MTGGPDHAPCPGGPGVPPPSNSPRAKGATVDGGTYSGSGLHSTGLVLSGGHYVDVHALKAKGNKCATSTSGTQSAEKTEQKSTSASASTAACTATKTATGGRWCKVWKVERECVELARTAMAVILERDALKTGLELPVALAEKIEPGIPFEPADIRVFNRWGMALVLPMLSSNRSW